MVAVNGMSLSALLLARSDRRRRQWFQLNQCGERGDVRSTGSRSGTALLDVSKFR